jgi:uncharacterized DUF497 family protein
MKTVSSIKWTDESIEHIARHAIAPREVEEVCFNEDDSPFIRSGKENLHYIFGKTFAGRFLFIVVKFIRHGEVSVITARDMNEWEKKYFTKRGK